MGHWHGTRQQPHRWSRKPDCRRAAGRATPAAHLEFRSPHARCQDRAVRTQAAACNRLHSNEERLSRWLLMSHDRVGVDEFAITHEFLGQMLGSRRATVTLSAGILQAAGLIRYQRGHVTILDREGLEAVACECYLVIKSALDQVIVNKNHRPA